MTDENQRTSEGSFDEPAGDRLLVSSPVDAYRLNAFRITGLETGVLARELNTHVEKLRMLERLGNSALYPRGPLSPQPPPDLESLRDAMQRLRNPVQRLIEEIFWFWPATEARAENDVALKALETSRIQLAVDTWRTLERAGKDSIVAIHNLAVLFHFLAIEGERTVLPNSSRIEGSAPQDPYWRASLTRWARVLGQEPFWCFVRARTRELDDPRLGDDALLRLRDCLPFTLASTAAQLAVRAVEQSDLAGAARLVGLVRGSGFDSSVLDDSLESAVEPLRARLRVARDDAIARLEASPDIAAAAGDQLLDHAAPLLAGMDLLLPPTHPALIATHDEVALCAMRAAVAAGNSSEQWAQPIEILRKARELAQSESAKSRITGNLQIASENEHWRVDGKPFADLVAGIVNSAETPSSKFAELKESGVSKLASLQERNPSDSQLVVNVSNMLAIALRGVSIALHNDVERYREALEALELAIQICRDASLREQLRGDLPVLQQHAEQAAAIEGLKPIRRVPPLSTLNGIGTQLLGASDVRAGTYMTTLYLTVFWIPVFPLARYRVANLGGNTYRFLGRGPLRRIDRLHQIGLAIAMVWLVATTSGSGSKPTPAPPANNFAGTRTEQLMSEVRSQARPAKPVQPLVESRESEIASLEREIESEKHALTTMESDLDQMKAQLAEYQAEIDRDKAAARLLESEAAAGVSIDRAEYDAAVRRHNANVALHNALLTRFREKYKIYEKLLADANGKIATRNSLVQGR